MDFWKQTRKQLKKQQYMQKIQKKIRLIYKAYIHYVKMLKNKSNSLQLLESRNK